MGCKQIFKKQGHKPLYRLILYGVYIHLTYHISA